MRLGVDGELTCERRLELDQPRLGRVGDVLLRGERRNSCLALRDLERQRVALLLQALEAAQVRLELRRQLAAVLLLELAHLRRLFLQRGLGALELMAQELGGDAGLLAAQAHSGDRQPVGEVVGHVGGTPRLLVRVVDQHDSSPLTGIAPDPRIEFDVDLVAERDDRLGRFVLLAQVGKQVELLDDLVEALAREDLAREGIDALGRVFLDRRPHEALGELLGRDQDARARGVDRRKQPDRHGSDREPDEQHDQHRSPATAQDPTRIAERLEGTGLSRLAVEPVHPTPIHASGGPEPCAGRLPGFVRIAPVPERLPRLPGQLALSSRRSPS